MYVIAVAFNAGVATYEAVQELYRAVKTRDFHAAGDRQGRGRRVAYRHQGGAPRRGGQLGLVWRPPLVAALSTPVGIGIVTAGGGGGVAALTGPCMSSNPMLLIAQIG